MRRRRTVVLIAPAFVLVFAASFLASRLIVRAFNGPPAGCTPPDCSGAIGVNGQNNLSVGTSSPLANTKLLIVASDTSASNYSLQVLQPAATPIFVIRNDGEIGIGTVSPNYTLDVSGTVNATTLRGAFIGTLSAGNISSGVFGANTGGGNYAFPSGLGIATSTNASLPQPLSVYGGGYFSGDVGIGTTAPDTRLVVAGDGSGLARIGGGTGCGSDYTGISLNGEAFSGCGNYNFLSGPSDQNLYINRPSGNAIMFRENNTDQMIIASGGNVGIGTTAPATKLDVSDNISIRSGFNLGNTTIGSNATSAALYVLAGNQNSGVANSPAGGFGIVGGGNIASPIVWMYASAGVNAFQVRSVGWDQSVVNAPVLFDVDTSGNVGIGTSAPSQKLDVEGNAYVSANGFYPLTLNSTDGAGNGPGIIWENGGTTQWYTYVGGSGTFYFSDSANNIMSIARGAPAGSLNIASTGDVGIGVSPAYTLDVNGPIKTRSASGIIFSDGTSQGTTANWSGTANYLTKADPSFPGAVKLGLSQVYDNGTNVGIGTTNPGAKLEVNGTGIFRSTLYVSNNGTSGGSGATGAIVLGDGTISKAYGSGFTMNSSLTLNGGSGKLTAGTVDPVYTIGGSRYATYGPEAVGVNVEKFGTVTLAGNGSACDATLDFANAAKGSGLWLFAKTTNLKDNFGKLAVELTPSFDGSVWYKGNTANLTLQIFASAADPAACDGAQVSYHLTAPRFDASQWSNFVPASESANTTGLIIND